MRVKILKRSFAGAEFAPDVRVLKVGGQSSAGVEKLTSGLQITVNISGASGSFVSRSPRPSARAVPHSTQNGTSEPICAPSSHSA